MNYDDLNRIPEKAWSSISITDFEANPEHYLEELLAGVHREAQDFRVKKSQLRTLPDNKAPKSEELLNYAKVLLTSKDFRLARTIYQSLISQKLCMSDAYYGTAVCYDKENQIELALQSYERAIQYLPKLVYLKQFASFLVRNQRWIYAQEILERTLRDPELDEKDRFIIQMYRAKCLVQTKEPDLRSTLEAVVELIRKNPNQGSSELKAELIENLANLYLAQQDFLPAYATFKECLDQKLIQPKVLLPFVKLAYQLKNYEPAIQVLEKYIQSSPFNCHLVYSLAGFYYHVGKLEQCKSAVELILELQANHEGALKLSRLLNLPGGKTNETTADHRNG